jgi:hypothetical protein
VSPTSSHPHSPPSTTPRFLRVPDLDTVSDPLLAGSSPGLLLPSYFSSHLQVTPLLSEWLLV